MGPAPGLPEICCSSTFTKVEMTWQTSTHGLYFCPEHALCVCFIKEQTEAKGSILNMKDMEKEETSLVPTDRPLLPGRACHTLPRKHTCRRPGADGHAPAVPGTWGMSHDLTVHPAAAPLLERKARGGWSSSDRGNQPFAHHFGSAGTLGTLLCASPVKNTEGDTKSCPRELTPKM